MFGLKRAKPSTACSFCKRRFRYDPEKKAVRDLGREYGQVCEDCLMRALGWAARESLGKFGLYAPAPPSHRNVAPPARAKSATEEAGESLVSHMAIERVAMDKGREAERERWLAAASGSLCDTYRAVDLLDVVPEMTCGHSWCEGILDMLHRVVCDGESIHDLDGARGQIIRAGGTP